MLPGVTTRTEEMRRALEAATSGDRAAETSLFALLYEDLRELAHERRSALARNESLRTTDLVNECWLRLYGGAEPRWENRRHFFGAAANAMRNILVDRARRRSALKREAQRKEELDADAPEFALEEPVTDLLSLHLLLEELEQHHPRPARVVTLRFFAGLAMPEIAEVLGISLASAERDWRFGRAWLQRSLGDDAG
jgi:RNA polymerase sigma factor (TIGR02999 family)